MSRSVRRVLSARIFPRLETSEQFLSKHRTKIGAYKSPVVENPKLVRQFFRYISRDHGGHFQTGRGYDANTKVISIFEPYEESMFYSGAPMTGKIQYVSASDLLEAINANLDYFVY